LCEEYNNHNWKVIWLKEHDENPAGILQMRKQLDG
jgi:hypothetical protein